MKHIFPFQRGFLKAVRPIANRVSPVELPGDSYFANIQELFGKLNGIDTLLEDPNTTSVRRLPAARRAACPAPRAACAEWPVTGT